MADLYVGTAIDNAIAAADPVIREEVANAWNAGFKAAALQYGPGSAYWETAASIYLSGIKKETRGPTWGTVAIGTGAGFTVGAALAFAAALIIAH